MRRLFQTLLLSALVGVPGLIPASAAGQTQVVPIKIALVSIQQGVVATRQGQQMVKDIQTQFTPLQTKLKVESADIDALKKQLSTGRWTAAERTSRQAAIDAKNKQLGDEADAAQKAYADAMQKAYEPIATAFGKVALDYVQRKGFTVLLDVSDTDSTVMWVRPTPSTDVTEAVVKAYDAGGAVDAAEGATAPQAIPAKIALINFEQAVYGTEEGKQAVAEMQTKYAPKKAELDGLTAEVERLKKEVQAGRFSDAERASRLKTIDTKQTQLDNETKAASDAYTAEVQESLGKVAQKVNQSLTDYVSRGGYTILFDKPGTKLDGVLWAAAGVKVDSINVPGGTTLDVSASVVQAYDAGHPMPGAAPPPAVAQGQKAPQPAAQVAYTVAPPAQQRTVATPPTAQTRTVQPETGTAVATVTTPVNGGGAAPRPTALANGRYFALVIGIDQYPPGIPTLVTAVADANAVGDELHSQYGFVVKRLLEKQATRVNILNQINWYRDNLREDDNLLIYYAGHGFNDTDAKRAYWLPVDAESAYSPNRISADDLAAEVRVQAARHVLIISDSCYSGELSRDLGITPRPSDQEIYLRYMGKMLKSRSRTIMASGGNEPVSDDGRDGHSVFAYALLEALKEEDRSVFAADDLFNAHVKQLVGGASEQQPRYDVIRDSNHEEGDFVFMQGGVASSGQ